MKTDCKAQVTQFLKERVNGDLTSPIIWYGFKQYFVEAIRNSSAHNLEEQLIFGTDSVSKFYIDEEENEITEIHYCTTDNVEEVPNHFFVKTTVYKNPETKGDEFIFDENKLIASESVGVTFGEEGSQYSNKNGIYFLNGKLFKFDENSSLNSYPKVDYITQKDELIYVQDDLTELLVAIKYSLINYTKDNKKITFMYIENKLKGE